MASVEHDLGNGEKAIFWAEEDHWALAEPPDSRIDKMFDEALEKNIQRNRETLRNLGFEPVVDKK